MTIKTEVWHRISNTKSTYWISPRAFKPKPSYSDQIYNIIYSVFNLYCTMFHLLTPFLHRWGCCIVLHSEVSSFFSVFSAALTFLWSGANCRISESKISFSLSLTSIFHGGEQEVWGRLEASAVAPSCHYPLSRDAHYYMWMWCDEGLQLMCVASGGLCAETCWWTGRSHNLMVEGFKKIWTDWLSLSERGNLQHRPEM